MSPLQFGMSLGGMKTPSSYKCSHKKKWIKCIQNGRFTLSKNIYFACISPSKYTTYITKLAHDLKPFSSCRWQH